MAFPLTSQLQNKHTVAIFRSNQAAEVQVLEHWVKTDHGHMAPGTFCFVDAWDDEGCLVKGLGWYRGIRYLYMSRNFVV